MPDMERRSLKNPRTALRTWAGLLALLACAIAAGEYAAMRHGLALRAARPDMYLEEAVARLNAGDFPGALVAWQQAEERGPNDPAVYKVKGDIHHRMAEAGKAPRRVENWKKAVVAYEKALRLGSKAPGVRMNLLACHLNLEQYDAVVAAGRRFLDEGATDPAYYRFIATACFRRGRFVEAVPYLRAALEGFPNDLYLMGLLKQTYEKTGQAAKAGEMDVQIRDVESRLNTLSGGAPHE